MADRGLYHPRERNCGSTASDAGHAGRKFSERGAPGEDCANQAGAGGRAGHRAASGCCRAGIDANEGARFCSASHGETCAKITAAGASGEDSYANFWADAHQRFGASAFVALALRAVFFPFQSSLILEATGRFRRALAHVN